MSDASTDAVERADRRAGLDHVLSPDTSPDDTTGDGVDSSWLFCPGLRGARHLFAGGGGVTWDHLGVATSDAPWLDAQADRHAAGRGQMAQGVLLHAFQGYREQLVAASDGLIEQCLDSLDRHAAGGVARRASARGSRCLPRFARGNLAARLVRIAHAMFASSPEPVGSGWLVDLWSDDHFKNGVVVLGSGRLGESPTIGTLRVPRCGRALRSPHRRVAHPPSPVQSHPETKVGQASRGDGTCTRPVVGGAVSARTLVASTSRYWADASRSGDARQGEAFASNGPHNPLSRRRGLAEGF